MKKHWKGWEVLCDILEKNIQGRTSGKCKSPETGVCLMGPRGPVWLECSEPGGGCLGTRSEK